MDFESFSLTLLDYITDAIIDRFSSLHVLIPGDRWSMGQVTSVNQGLGPAAGVGAAA